MLMPDLFGDSRDNMIPLSENNLIQTNLPTENSMAKTHISFSKKLITYLLILFSISFVIGSFTLILLLKSIVIYIRNTGWLSSNENMVVIAISLFILLFILLFAKWLTIWFTESTNTFSKSCFSIIVAILVSLCLLQWIPGKKAPFPKQIVSANKKFVGGPYPDKTSLNVLKSQGITTIVSLLDPLALPTEPFLIKEEDDAVAELGLNLIRIPMLSGKVHSLEADKRIQLLAKSEADQKYYVHGYRDQDRVLMFMKLVDQLAPAPTTSTSKTSTTSTQSTVTSIPQPQPDTTINGHKTINLERGTAIQLDSHIIVSPKPTLDELKKYFLTTPNPVVGMPIHTVVSLSPDESSDQSSEIISLLKTRSIAFYTLPIQIYPYDSKAVLKIVEKVKSLSGGVLVYSYYMPPQSTAASAFILSYLTNLPPLPASLFMGMPMQDGTVKTIAPNVAIGPRPADSEFKDYLAVRGINSIGYAGPCDSQESKSDSRMAELANLKWVCLQDKNAIIFNVLKSNGPWYVYGPVLPLIEAELTKRMGILMPDHALQGQQMRRP